MGIKKYIWPILALLWQLTCLTPIAYAQNTPVSESIDLPFKDAPMAIFIKQKTLWLVIGNDLHLTVDSFSKLNSSLITSIKQLPSAQAAIFLLTLKEDVSLSADKLPAGGVHIFMQSTTPANPAQRLAAYVHTNDTKQYYLSIATKTANNILSIIDPNNGREFQIIPVAENAGFFHPRSFTEFNILQTAQGIVIQKIADDVSISLNKNIIDITAPKGLKISADVAEEINREAENIGGGGTLFPDSVWKLTDNKNYVPLQEKLFHDVAYGNMESSDKARLRLLQIYLSSGMFPEAKGMANDILRTSYKFYRANKIAALRGAAYFFMRRYEEAARDFASPELASDKETEMWLSLSKEMMGEGHNTFDFSENYDRYISKYPPSFIQKLALIQADLSINHKDYDEAHRIFGLLVKDNLNEPVQKFIDFMHAKIFSETKNEDEAAKIWEKQAGLVDDPLIRASASFSLINMRLRQEKMAPEKAIRELEKLLVVWRGDDLELNILTLLGNLYIEQKEYAKALHTLRDIVMYYPQSPQVIPISAKMEEIFVNLYNKGVADTLLPLDALALFYEFRDLVPPGKDGDMMIRNLADRLVGIDLLGRAEDLLDHQVEKRLQGYERSRVGAHLAEIYLENHEPKEALDTLKTTGYGELPADLQLMRLRLTAKALAEQNHSDKAIEVLSTDNSAEGNLLRLKIYWDNKDWPNVTLTAEEILSNRNDPTAPLTLEESEVLLKLATAYVYEHDNGQIQYLRDYFTPLLKNNPNKESFIFITSESGTLDYENLTTLDNDINAVKNFIDKSQGKSATPETTAAAKP